ncbi:MAG: BMP family ABC transporter substrate-binding protein, partial [Clostridia bacterium]|nr:BMP family ABC transporter substrate-binding protein [Clostridia bacterium]
MFKRVLSLCLALLMVAAMGLSMVSCSDSDDDFKLGVILLHDEASTYDLNFIEAVERAAAELGLDETQVIYKKNIPESNACYEAAADLVDEGCDVIFADSFG